MTRQPIARESLLVPAEQPSSLVQAADTVLVHEAAQALGWFGDA